MYSTVATLYGKLEEFDPAAGEDWIQYIERMEYHFLANGDTSTEQRQAVLISAMGAKAYKILQNLITSATPSDKSFNELVDVMKKHFCPPPSEIVQRFKFNTRIRQSGESVANYIAELRALSQYCNFGDTLELMLRDRIVCGINDMQTQKRLLAEKNLTFTKAREIALALESAVQGTRDIQTPSGTTVHKVADGNKPNSYKCYRCGKTNHKAPQCRHKNTVCNKCNKTGHLAKVCQSKKDTTASSSISKKQLSTHVVTEQSPSEEKEEYSLFTIHGTKGVKAKTDPLFVTVNLNGKQVSMELDTASAVTIMAESKFKEVS